MVSNRAIALPSADVLWWDNRNVRIRCPFCTKSHRHGIGYSDRYEKKSGSRVAHCPPVSGILSHHYQFSFPFDRITQHVAYEIDKEKGRFVTVGILQDPEPNETTTLAGSLASDLDLTNEDVQLVSFDDATEMTSITLSDHDPLDPDGTFSQQTILNAISDCIRGDVRNVKEYLETTAEQHIFLYGKDEQGDSTLSYAAVQRSPSMVALILEKAAEVNSRNRRGRTPLMEAALWGRAGNARTLLEYGADKTLRDCHGRTASDLASSSDENSDEREARAGRVYREIAYNADRQRKAIVRLLQDQPAPSQIPLSTADSIDPDYHHFSFHKSPQTSSIELSAPTRSFTVPRKTQTTARLDRGLPFPPIDAMSGWGHYGEGLIMISGRNWTEEVFRICRLVGHQLTARSGCDQGRTGWFSACHAEKQLVAYLLSKHTFSDDETLEGAENEHGNRPTAPALRELYLAQPPVSLRTATILVSRKECLDCVDFISAVETHFNLTIRCVCIDFEEQAKAFVRQKYPYLGLPADWPAHISDLER